jgi:hypothetical protein
MVQNPGPGLPSEVAYRQVEAHVNLTGGGPWGLFSLEGVISTAPAAPFEGSGEDICQTLPGPTLWNLSGVVDLTTTLWGGRSVFWQFVYINETNSLIFASDIEGRVLVDGPVAAQSPCAYSLENGIGGLFSWEPSAYWQAAGQFDSELIQSVYELNSTLWAPTAATHVGNASLSSWGGNLVAYYTLGFTWLNLVDWTEGGWLVWYWACGVPGRSGEQPYAETGWGLNSDPTTFYGSGEGSTSCPVNTNAHFQVNYTQSSASKFGSGSMTGEHLSVGLGNGTYVYYSTANSLVSWMTQVSLKTSAGIQVHPSSTNCNPNASSLDGCTAPAEGWYAALLSPDGYLLDTFPTTAGGSQWETPNVFVTNNDTLAIVSASTLVGSGDVLSITPAYSFPQVLGNATL